MTNETVGGTCWTGETPDMEIYSSGICFCSVCSCLTPEETVDRVNATMPTGISSKWRLHEGQFRDGSPNPRQCDSRPNHKHYLMSC